MTGTLGLIYGKLGRVDDALTHIHKARAILADLGMTGEVNRNDWVLATTVLEAGDYTRAIEILQVVRNTFLSLSMAQEAALAGLDLADALIVRARLSEARQGVEASLAQFIAAK